MLILGCDPSLTDHGWSVIRYENDKLELLDSGRIRTKSKELQVVRYERHWEEFEALLEKHQPDYVGMEIPPPQASYSAGLYPIWVRMASLCKQYRIPYATWMPSSLKSYAKEILDDPKAKKLFKSDMVEAAQILLDSKARINHNIADSIIVNAMTFKLWSVVEGVLEESDLSEKEKHLLTRVHTKRTGEVEKKGMVYKEGDMYFNLKDPKYDYLYE